jgi:FMN phosphatase YigB (HAD superfamily)
VKRIIVCDLDGTLCDAAHRRHLVDGSQPRDWDQFYDRCDMDPPHYDVLELINTLHQKYNLVYVTGRVERVRKKTEAWLRRHYAPYGPVFMRPDGDHRQDYVLKEEIAACEGLTKNSVLVALDDRDQVVEMWRRLGIRCLQVAKGNF